MLSRISSFSGPSSKLFKKIVSSATATFTISGLILRYEMKGTQSYSGTNTVKDMIGNSDAALTNGPLYSTNGYVSFDGSNDYLITSTSLNSKLSPANTSTVISYFAWVYPTDNGVIVTEQGNSSLNTSWHDAQIEIVSGTMRFGVWNGLGSTYFSSSISTPLYRWYYAGITYDGTTLRGYIDAQLAGSTNVARSTPYMGSAGLHYALGATDFTSLGDGTYAKAKLGAFHVYNTALTQTEISNNYSVTKSDYIYSTDLLIWADANDSQSFSGGKVFDLSGNGYTHSFGASGTSSTLHGIRSFDCNTANAFLKADGTGPTLSASGYTYVSWAKLLPSSAGWRTLYRTAPNDHPIVIQIGSDKLGFYDNDANAFMDSGYDAASLAGKWAQWAVVGDSSSSTFYINGDQVGSTVAYGAGGNKHDYFGGLPGQPFGYVGNMMLYNAKLTQAQVKQNYDALKHVYEQGNFTTDSLGLYYNPGNLLSYAGSGTSISDLSGNSMAGTMSNVTFETPYLTFNGSTSQIAVSDGSAIEPGSGDWTMEAWFNPANVSGAKVVLGKFRGGGAADVSYSIRMSGSNLFAQIGNGLGSTLNTHYANSTNYALSANTWYQAVFVYSNTGDTLKTYINGALQSSVSCTIGNLLDISESLYIGSFNNGQFAQYFAGKIGIVRLYGKELSAAEVLLNFNTNKATYGL